MHGHVVTTASYMPIISQLLTTDSQLPVDMIANMNVHFTAIKGDITLKEK
jgi:hypothetical protein